MSKKQLTRDEQFLAKAAGDDVQLPNPLTKVQEFLERIVERLSSSVTTDMLNNIITPISESIAQLNRKTIQLRHGKGTFNATATGTNVMWQYGGQQVQDSKCTFDVKSDNGLICMDFSNSITSLTISYDAALKLCLSDLGGRITDGLTLSGCSGVTGDLSDLGGNITGGIALNGCPSITGDLSDLGGKISRTILLTGCTAITGIYTGTAYPKTFTVSKTSITATDMDTNLINFAASGVKSGKFTAANMTRTAASDDAVATLVTNGWTVSGLKKEG